MVSQWCSGGVPCLGGVLVSHCWSGRVSVVCRYCPSNVPVVSRGVPVRLQCLQWCPGGVCPSRVPVVSQWRLVVFQWCPVVSRWLVSQWCLEGVPVLFQWGPGRVPCFLGPGGVPPSGVGVPVVSGVPRRVGVLLVRWLVGLRWGGAGR